MNNLASDVTEARKKLAKRFEANNQQRGKNGSRRTKTVNHKHISESNQILSSLRDCCLKEVENTVEANIFVNDGMVYHFEHPVDYNTTVIIEMDNYFPDILPQLGEGVLSVAMHVALEMMNTDEYVCLLNKQQTLLLSLNIIIRYISFFSIQTCT